MTDLLQSMPEILRRCTKQTGAEVVPRDNESHGGCVFVLETFVRKVRTAPKCREGAIRLMPAK